MANPLDYFEVGRNVGKAKRSTFGRVAEGVMGDFQADKERKLKEQSELSLYKKKQAIQSPKEIAETDFLKAKSGYFNKLSPDAGIVDEDTGMVLDRMGPGGPTFVNQAARNQAKVFASQATQMPKLDRAFDAIQTLKGQYQRSLSPVSIPKGSNPASGFLSKAKQGFSGKIGAASGSNPELNRYKANRGGFASLISKGGFLEAGVLTEGDIQRMLAILPSEFSSKEEADIAWREIESVLSGARNRMEGGGVKQGFSSQGSVEQKYDQLVEELVSTGMGEEEAMAQADQEFGL